MNTKEKGDSFENFVFDYFTHLITKGYLGLSPTHTKIYKQHRYYSKDREGYIIFDVAIEVFLLDQEEPYLILLIECKDYTKSVPVDDIEEFSAKVSQVGNHNTKAICVTTKGFQKGALTVAKNRKIGLWRIIKNDNNHNIIFNRTINRIKEKNEIIQDALTLEEFNNISSGNVYIQTPLRFTSTPRDLTYDFLLSQNDINPQDFFTQHRINSSPKSIPYKSKKQLSTLAENLFNTHQKGNMIVLDEIINHLGYKLVESTELNDLNIIAELQIQAKIITIFGVNHYSLHQINFAKSHEIAHIFLNHERYIILDKISTTGKSYNTYLDNNINQNIDRIEFQANYFAACLLLPEKILKATLYYYLVKHDVKNRGFSPLYIDKQPCNLENYSKIFLPLTQIFNVSQETLKIRLTELGLANFSF